VIAEQRDGDGDQPGQPGILAHRHDDAADHHDRRDTIIASAM
jgi:hypothetical protein